MAHVELMVGRRTHFFTSIPYASDQLSSTCRVTLHGGFNRQAARVTRNSFTRALALLFLFHRFLLRFNTGKLFPAFIKSKQFLHIHEYAREICTVLFANYILIIYIYILNFLK